MDEIFHTSSTKIVEKESDTNVDRYNFKSTYKTPEELAKADMEYGEKVTGEGAVLLKNKNNALPLKSSEKKVTLVGKAAYSNVLGGQIGFSDAQIDDVHALSFQLFCLLRRFKQRQSVIPAARRINKQRPPFVFRQNRTNKIPRISSAINSYLGTTAATTIDSGTVRLLRRFKQRQSVIPAARRINKQRPPFVFRQKIPELRHALLSQDA